MSTSANAVAVRPLPQITELPRDDPGAVMEQVIIRGDLSELQPAERARYYVEVCRSVGLNPLTRPFLYVKFSEGGLQLYPRKEAADQLRSLHKVQTRIVEQKVEQGVYVVVVEARHPDGRVETDIGAVPIKGLEGLFLANAMKKSISQGKRRATLAMLGLSLIDDDEIRAIKGARFVEVDPETGDVEASARVIERRAAPAGAEPGMSVDPATIGDRKAEATALAKAVEAAFGLRNKPAQMVTDTAENLICWRFGYQSGKEASAEDLAEVRAGLESWAEAHWVSQGLHWLEQVGAVDDESSANATLLLLDEAQVDDPFVHAALAERLREFASDDTPDIMATVDAAVNRVITP